MLHLKRTFLLLFFAIASISFADAQNLIVKNTSCGSLDIDIVFTSSPCGPSTSSAFIVTPPGVNSYSISSFISFLHPSESANLSNFTPNAIYDPACGLSNSTFPQPFSCNGSMYNVQMTFNGVDYFLDIF